MAEHYQGMVVTQPKKEHVLRELIFSLFVRSGLIIVIFLAVFLFALVLAIALPSIYKATAKFSMTLPKTMDPLERTTAYDYRNQFKRQLNEQKELITSDRVLIKVIEELSLGSKRNVAKTLAKLRKKLEVTPPKGETFEDSNFYYLTFKDRTAHRATKMAHAVADAYLETFRELAQEKVDYSYSFYKEQSQELYDRMHAEEIKLRDYEREQAVILIEILNLDAGGNSSNAETGPNALLTRFIGKYHELQEELAGIRMAINMIEKPSQGKRIPVVPPEMEEAGRAITVFKRKVAQLQIQLNEMKPRFRQKFELLRQVEKELNLNIASLKRELERSVAAQKIQAQSIEARLVELEKTIEELKERIRFTAAEKSKYDQLRNAFALAKEAYVSAMTQLEEARLGQALNKEKQHITYIDKPMVPDKPFKPNRILIVILGFIAGAFLGIATSLMFDFFDHSIRRHEDIDQYLEITILGSIPELSLKG
jgi:uncharacterized protein involved in exopolysaccharide biosynthesis